MIHGLTVSTTQIENWFGLTWLTGLGFLVSKTSSLLVRFAILGLAVMNDSIEWGLHFEEMEFEFLEFSLVGSHWMVFSARFSYKSHPSFSSFCKNPLGTWFLRRSWLSSLNRYREFGISPFLYSMMSTLDKEVFEAFKVPPKWSTRFSLELHDVFSNESGLMNWIEFLQEDLDETIPRCES